jgi:broad specificity phosphatase PhoE
MGWSHAGATIAAQLTDRLGTEAFDRIVHSGATRTRRLAERIGRSQSCPVLADPRWHERDFGAWEGRSWQAIWRESGALMDRMMTHPASFRPGGGETGHDLTRRVRAAWADLPRSGSILVVAHGGSIAALRTWLAGQPLEAMAGFIPQTGEIVRVEG